VLTVNTIQTYSPRAGRYDHAIMRKGILPVLVLSACLAISACGGSSGSSSTGPGTSSTASPAAAKAAFDKQLSSLCRRANAAYIKASKGAKAAVIQHYLALFKTVKAPPQLDSSYALYLAVIAKELRALKRGDTAALAKIRDTQAGPLVGQLGATGCYG
jgi:hypothetical protein